MKAYLTDLIPKIQRFSQKIDDLTKITNQRWVSIGDINQSKRVYIFKPDKQLLISNNGIAEKGHWEYIDHKTIHIETNSESFLLNQGFFDGKVLALKLDGTESYAFFVNETKFKKEINGIEDVLLFLQNTYLNKKKLFGGVSSTPKGLTDNSDYQIKYEILRTTLEWDISWGKYLCFTIKYFNGFIGAVFKGSNSGEYFYQKQSGGRVYCKSQEDAITKLFYDNYKRE